MRGDAFGVSAFYNFGLYYFNVLFMDKFGSIIPFGIPYKRGKYHRQECRSDPEPVYHREVVYFRAVDHGLVSFDKYTVHHILQSGTKITGDAYNPKCSTCGCLGRDIHCHKTAKEADQHTDAETEEHHCRDIKPEMLSRNKEEQTQRQCVHKPRYECRHIA